MKKDLGASVRARLLAIAKARCKSQIDIGYGDAVTPGPVQAVYPVLIDDPPAPRLHTYPVYTVVSEKAHAIDLLGYRCAAGHGGAGRTADRPDRRVYQRHDAAGALDGVPEQAKVAGEFDTKINRVVAEKA